MYFVVLRYNKIQEQRGNTKYYLVQKGKIMSVLKGIVKKYNDTSLIVRIVIGLIIGAALGVAVPGAKGLSVFGDMFVGALKAVAPILVFVLVIASLCQSSSKLDRRFGLVIVLYLAGTTLGGVTAVVGSSIFPQTITFAKAAASETNPPSGFAEVFHNLLMNLVDNPVSALVNANYLGILAWAVILGLALKIYAADSTRRFMSDLSDAVSQAVRWVINLAPFGIMGLMFTNVSSNGLAIFKDYGSLLLLLIGCMFFAVLVVNPLLCFIILRRNPYPLLMRCLKESAVMAFFTRSSAANIPVNLKLCEKLGLDEDMYTVSIPLGATINMNGAAITIAVMTMAACHTLHIQVDIASSVVLCVLAALSAAGASGVAGGSLMLIPMACSLFGISNDLAMQVVGVGFIVGVIQDSLETALNSSGDVFWTATAEYKTWMRQGKELPTFLGGSRQVGI